MKYILIFSFPLLIIIVNKELSNLLQEVHIEFIAELKNTLPTTKQFAGPSIVNYMHTFWQLLVNLEHLLTRCKLQVHNLQTTLVNLGFGPVVSLNRTRTG